MITNEITFTRHVVVIGWDDFARDVVVHLLNAEKKVCVITADGVKAQTIAESYNPEQLQVLCADPNNFDKIKGANIEEAAVIVINLPSDTDKLVYIINFKKAFEKEMKIVAPINNPNLKDSFYKAGVRYPLSKDEIAAKMVSSYFFERDVALMSNDLLATSKVEDDYDILQLKVIDGNPFLNMDCGAAFKKVKEHYNGIFIGLSKARNGDRKLIKNPPSDTKIDPGDYMLVIVDGISAALMKKAFDVEEGLID